PPARRVEGPEEDSRGSDATGARSLRHGTRADPVRGFAAGAKPTTGGESVDSPRIGGELPDAKTRTGRRGLP
ncbi:MAG: hypothetical protein ACK53T_19490, partial [Planctomycetota bacterium]